MNLTLFDLDHTLLAGDSDVIWCEFLMQRGLLDRDQFAARNAQMEARYRAGAVSPQEFAGFYVSTLVGRAVDEWDGLRREFLKAEILPRIPQTARDLVVTHQQAGDLVVLTTATNRFLTELTARALEIGHLLATEVEVQQGRFTGRPAGTLNMREGKVTRLHEWLAQRGQQLAEFDVSTAYSDSINDLPLLLAVNQPVAVNPDAKLEEVAVQRHWPVLRLH